MSRTQTTKLLTEVLISDRLRDRKYYAKEVTLDYSTDHTKRIDVMQFIPQGVIHISDIEKGIFICYEIKSCKDDVFSGNGLNFFGEKNYIVTTMETYRAILSEINNGFLSRFISEHYPESSQHYGIMIPVPRRIDLRNSNDLYEEFEKPTPFNGDPTNWKLWTAISCNEGSRDRSTVELLFCMLRSKHSSANRRANDA